MEMSVPPQSGGISWCLECHAKGIVSPLRARFVGGMLETSCQSCGQTWTGKEYAAVIKAHAGGF